jgi:hypothetical protein
VTVSVAVLVVPLYDAVIVTVVLAETVDVTIVNVPVKPVAGTVTLAGTPATTGLLLERERTARHLVRRRSGSPFRTRRLLLRPSTGSPTRP